MCILNENNVKKNFVEFVLNIMEINNIIIVYLISLFIFILWKEYLMLVYILYVFFSIIILIYELFFLLIEFKICC